MGARARSSAARPQPALRPSAAVRENEEAHVVGEFRVRVGVSVRHVHLSQEHVEQLFGAGHRLTELRPLTQPGQYAASEVLILEGPRGRLEGVRVLGPPRSKTQVEISRTDAFGLGLVPPLRESGCVAGTPGIWLVGPAGRVALTEGVIMSKRHLHMSTDEARAAGVVDGQEVSVSVEGPRALVFHKVVTRVRDDYVTELHVDTDEGNAAGVSSGDTVTVVVGP